MFMPGTKNDNNKSTLLEALVLVAIFGIFVALTIPLFR
jgi:hypothetical protein